MITVIKRLIRRLVLIIQILTPCFPLIYGQPLGLAGPDGPPPG